MNDPLLSTEEKRRWLARVFRDTDGEYSQADKFKALVEDTKLAALQQEEEEFKRQSETGTAVQDPLLALLRSLPPPNSTRKIVPFSDSCGRKQKSTPDLSGPGVLFNHSYKSAGPPCGERLDRRAHVLVISGFQSTPSLRRATASTVHVVNQSCK